VTVRGRRKLLRDGVPGVATIASARETGWTVLGRTVVEFGLVVTVDGRSSHRTTTREAVSLTTIAQAVPGASVPVMAEGTNGGKVAIDWDAVGIVEQARHGRSGVAHLGLFGVLVHPRLADRLGLLPGDGVLVLEVTDGGPAQQAGVVPGDVLASADHTPLRRAEDLATVVCRCRPGQELSLTLHRAGSGRTVTTTATLSAGRL
jgi:membrane-associated protease RseP (regulator of RpoE activity)